MNEPIRILIVEDQISDVEILTHHLTKGGLSFTHQVVGTEEAYIEALESAKPDVILSDYHLPGFDSWKALQLRNQIAPEAPFILFTDSTNEEASAEYLKTGADDYLIKEHLNRLGSAVHAALETKMAIRTKVETEESLRHSEVKYRKIFENIQDIFYQVDSDGFIREISPSIYRYSGYTREELIGKPVAEVYYSPEDMVTFLKKLNETGEIADYDVRLRTKEGQVRWASINVHTLFDSNGNPCGREGSLRDISDRKQAENIQKILYKISNAVATTSDIRELIGKIQLELSNLLDTTNFYVALLNEETGMLTTPYYQDEVDDLDTWPAEKSTTGYVIRTQKSLLASAEEIRRLIDAGEIEIVGVPASAWLGVPLFIEGKTIGALVIQSYDNPKAYTLKDMEMLEIISHQISLSIQRKRAEEALKGSEEKFRTIFSESPIGLELYDADGTQVMANAASFKMFGIPDESSAGFNLFKGTSLTEPLKKKLKHGEPIFYQASFNFDKVRALNQYHTTRTGTAAMEYNITPLKSEDQKNITGYLLQVQEITSRKRAEKIQQVLLQIANAFNTTSDLKDLDEKIRTELGALLDTSNFYIAYYDKTTGMLTTPHARDEKDCFDTWPAEKSITGYVIRHKKPLLVRRDEILAMHERGEIDLIGTTAQCWLGVPLYAEGTILGVLAVQSYDNPDAYQQQDMDMLTFVSSQISLAVQRKKSEEALRESENKYRTIFENIQDVFCRIGPDGNISEISPSVVKITGYSREELIGKQITALFYNPDERPAIYKEIQERGELKDYDLRLKTKDGLIRWASLNAHSVFDPAGNHLGGEGTLHDISERKKGEEVRQVLYHISRATLLPIDVEGLIEIIRQELGKLIDTENFFVAFYDEATGMLNAPYWKDAYDQISSWPVETSVSGIIIRDNKSLLLKREDIKALRSKQVIGEVEVHSMCWLGVPLREKGKAIGTFVVQSYTDSDAYTQQDLEMLEFVSHQISISIQRKKAELELNQALQQAQESDRLKSVFLANMSHEIRTPMNAILGFSDLLGQAETSPGEIERFTTIIRNSGARLMHLIDDIIDLSKLEANQIKITKTPCHVNQLMHATMNSFNNHALLKQKDLKLTLDLSGIKDPTVTVTDEVRLGQVLDNLVSNALKYTREGTIIMGAEQIEQNGSPWLRFSVSDTGKGIPQEKLPIIFERFRQVEEDDYHEGAGLGLSISKALVDLLGGEIRVVSEVGKGSTFSFTIPYTEPQAPSPSSLSHHDHKPFLLSGKKILMVDDDPDSVFYLSVLLQETGAMLTVASDGEMLMDLLQTTIPDLILLDINMPGKTGYECLKEIRKKAYPVKVISQTAYAMEDERLRCMELGSDAYLAKPYTKKELLDSIKLVLSD